MTGNLPEIGEDGSVKFPPMLVDNVEVYLHNLAFTTNELIKDLPNECPKKLLVIGTSDLRDLGCKILGREEPHYTHELIKELDNGSTVPEEYNMTLTLYEYKNVTIYYLQDNDASEEDGIYLCQPLEQQSFVLGRNESNG
jgi:hypothetical protein